jgi:FtsZ-interacting cell division protein ZipA
MDPRLIWLIVGAAVLVAIIVLLILRRQRSQRLRQRFGPEYERTVRETGDVRRAEAALEARATRVERLHIRPLTADDAQRFSTRWREVQTQFVDDPNGAVLQADALIGDVMRTRGYPVGDFEQRVADVSVDHPNVVMNYRAAKDIVDGRGRGAATTEDMRQAMVHYRALFAELVGEGSRPERHAEQPMTTGGTRR